MRRIFFLCFMLLGTFAAQALNAPSLSNPANAANSTYTRLSFAWNSVSGASSYTLQVDTSADFNSPLLADTTITQTSVYRNYLRYGTRYYWRVRANSAADTSAWSAVRYLTTRSTVNINSPENNYSTYTRLTFQWYHERGSLGYQLQIDTSADFNSPLLRNVITTSSLTSTTSDYSTTQYNFLFNATYYWRIRTYHTSDTSAWTTVRTFTTPTGVSLYSPSNDTNPSSAYYTRQIFQWYNSCGCTRYELQLDTTPAFSSPLLRTVATTNSATNTGDYVSTTISDMRFNTMYYWRVRAMNTADTSGWSAIRQFHTQTIAYLYSPSNDTNPNGTYYTRQIFQWRNSRGCIRYELQLDTTPAFSSPLLRTVATTNSATNTGDYVSTTISDMRFNAMYYWRVRAINAVDTSDWSATSQFHTQTIAYLYSPSNDTNPNGTYYTRQIFQWHNSRGCIRYELQLDTTPAFSSPLLRTVATSNSATNTGDYVSTTISDMRFNAMYYWRVRAINAVDTSDWSATSQFHTQTIAYLYSPSNDTNPNGTYYTRQIFQWRNSRGCIRYELQLDTTPAFSSPLLRNATASNSATNTGDYVSTTISDMRFNAMYYWRVRAINAVDTSDWSATSQFHTQTIAYLYSPSNDTNPNGTYYTRQIFQWRNSIGCTRYELQLDTTPAFCSPLSRTATATNSASNTGDYVSTTLYDMHYNTMYYWRVRAINADDTSDWSVMRQFHTQRVTSLYSPANNSTGLTPTNCLIQWNNSAGSSGYIIQIDTTPTFSSPLLQNHTKTNSQTNNDNYVYTTLSTLRYGTGYYWRVKAHNNADTSDWSDTRYFTTAYQNNSAPTLLSPANGDTAVSFTSAALSWQTLSGATSYRYQVSLHSNFDTLVAQGFTSLTFTAISNLIPSTTYYWRVQGCSGSGNTQFSTTWSFTTDRITLTPPQLAAPANGTTLMPIRATLAWHPVFGAHVYDVQLSLDNSFGPATTTFTTADTTQSAMGLPESMTFYWRVRSRNTTDTSAWSSPWQFTTRACITTYDTLQQSLCDGDSYEFFGRTLTVGGSYQQTLTNAEGCDSLITLLLTVHPRGNTVLADTACDSYTWQGTTYHQSGSFSFDTLTIHGCDSLVTLHLVIHQSASTEFADTACDSYTWRGTTYSHSGNFCYDTLTIHGCDSLVTLYLVIHQSANTEFADTADGQYCWNDSIYTLSGDYTQHLTTQWGCDSLVTLHLVINEVGIAVVGQAVPTLQLQPNPTHGRVVLTVTPAVANAAVVIRDALGRECLRRILAGEARHTLDLANLPAGIYLVTLTTPQGSATTKLSIR